MRTIHRTKDVYEAQALVHYADETEGMTLHAKRSQKMHPDGVTPAEPVTYVVQAPNEYDGQVCEALVRNFRQTWQAFHV